MQDGEKCLERTSGSMKKLLFVILLISSPVWAQTKLVAKGATPRVDDCAPIGRTAKGELVYSLKCENMPAPAPAQVEAEPAPVPTPTPTPTDSGGLLGRFPLESLGTIGRSPAGTPAMAAPASH
jgi:hypothetical protein